MPRAKHLDSNEARAVGYVSTTKKKPFCVTGLFVYLNIPFRNNADL